MRLIRIFDINENIIGIYYVKDINLYYGKYLIDIPLKISQSIK